ncbi:MAG: LacI family DNA-binding transcriptional regulator [Bacteroidota bacterium]|nr:LacI family DNA-binding transcriptional regulator [Bacteroidota bacterium]
MKAHQVTIKDIAKILGISISTVSRALKNHPDISEETKVQVKDLAHKLNYEPNALALNLRRSKTNTIGVIIPEIIHHFFSSVISGIEDVAYDMGYNVMICQSNESYEREVINAQALLCNRVDGVLISIAKTTLDFDHFRHFTNQGIPMVFFDRICPDIMTDRVITNDEGGAFLATEHLIKIGCKHIAHFAAPQHLLIGQGRFAGYQRALKQYQIQFDPRLVLNCNTRDGAFEKAAQFLNDNPDVDGIFAVNDNTAIAVMQIINKLGKKIPEDIAIVGFGDGPDALITSPPLTTIEQKGYDIGTEAVKLLIHRIENESSSDSFQTKVIPPNLIMRESTDKENVLSANV